MIIGSSHLLSKQTPFKVEIVISISTHLKSCKGYTIFEAKKSEIIGIFGKTMQARKRNFYLSWLDPLQKDNIGIITFPRGVKSSQLCNVDYLEHWKRYIAICWLNWLKWPRSVHLIDGSP